VLRLIIILFITVAIFACDSGDAMREAAKKNPVSHARMLAADNECMSCHAVGITVVGPAWTLVAKKYKDDASGHAYLVNKIKTGGKGNWNSMTASKSMPGYEDRLSDEEIGLLVDYILAL